MRGAFCLNSAELVYSKFAKWSPALFLIAANLIPISGIFLAGWDLFSVLFYYWLESLVVGIYNIPKMLMAHKNPTKHKLSGIIFFVIHYSGFMAGHGFFLYALFSPIKLLLSTVILGIGSLIISHGISFVINFIGRQEYQKVSVSEQMMAPYKRILVMHLTIIVCGFLLNLISRNEITLMILVVLKIVIDLTLHLREHGKLSRPVQETA
jgi:hypothetical protein